MEAYKEMKIIIASILIPLLLFIVIRLLNTVFYLETIIAALVSFVLGVSLIPGLVLYFITKQSRKIEKKTEEEIDKISQNWVTSEDDFVLDQSASIIIDGVYKILFGTKHKKLYNMKLTKDVLVLQRKKRGSKLIPISLTSIVANGYTIEAKGAKYVLEITLAEMQHDAVDHFTVYMEEKTEMLQWIRLINSLEERSDMKPAWEPELYPGKETVVFLNAVAHRFWLNLRESEGFKNKIKAKMYQKLNLKVAKKGYDNFLSDLEVEDLDVGNCPPSIQSAELLKVNENGDLIIDLSIDYHGGGLSFVLKTVVQLSVVGKKVEIPVKVEVTVISLTGQLRLVCHPYPHKKFSISFCEEPEIDFEVHILIGNLMKGMLPKIEKLIIRRIKLVILQQYVRPNRRFFRIPSSNNETFSEITYSSSQRDDSSDSSSSSFQPPHQN